MVYCRMKTCFQVSQNTNTSGCNFGDLPKMHKFYSKLTEFKIFKANSLTCRHLC